MNTAKNKPKSFPSQRQTPPGHESEMKPKPEVIRKNYKGSDKLKNKVALITGGDSGIGRSVAVHFAKEGADIAIIYLNENKDALETKKMVEEEGRKCLLLAGDIRNKEFCREAVEKVHAEFAELNILVNNAAEQHPHESLKDLDLDMMEKTFQTNIFAMFYITKAAIDYMTEGDVIINTSSVTSYRGSEYLLDYSATKGAITTFSRSLAANLSKDKIRVNIVAPGPIWTPLIPSTFEDVTDFGTDTLLGRAGQPSEVAPAYVFLASEDSAYITGQTIHVNGGGFISS
jgi:NAD(P)-dependent dehydrogenase (short-subunit alcohol dehydrogenase family)